VPGYVADDDRTKFTVITRAEDLRLQRHRFRQLCDIVAIDGTVAGEFGQGEVMGVEREKPQAIESSREQFGQAVRRRLRETRDGHVLKMDPMFSGER
jgi:hypothetical protein